MTRTVGQDLFLCHASPDGDDQYLLWTWADGRLSSPSPTELAVALQDVRESIVLCGHDHFPRTVEFNAGRLVADPGSVGLPAYSDTDPYPHSMETGQPHARYSIVVRSRSGWQVENVAVEYDWEAAAMRAEKNGRPDWARWLKTGRSD